MNRGGVEEGTASETADDLGADNKSLPRFTYPATTQVQAS